jgi:hypothetical protein
MMDAVVEGQAVSEIVVDAKLAEALRAIKGTVEIVDAEGQYLGTFSPPVRLTAPPPGYKPPFTDEELDRLSKVRTGRPLEDILRDLRAGHGGS